MASPSAHAPVLCARRRSPTLTVWHPRGTRVPVWQCEDVFYEMLDPTTPLGAAEGSYTSSETKTATLPMDGRTKVIIKTGAERTAVLPTGTTKSKLLHTTDPPTTPALIIWQQLETNLAGVNMYGAGEGDEPGVKIELTALNTATRVTLEYFYTELRESFDLFTVPQWQGVDTAELERRMVSQMSARGYTPTGDGAKSTSLPPAAALPAPGATAFAPAPAQVKLSARGKQEGDDEKARIQNAAAVKLSARGEAKAML
jgi:hypothetical protein